MDVSFETIQSLAGVVVATGVAYLWNAHAKEKADRKQREEERDKKIADQETALALLKQRVDGDHRRFEAQEKQLKEIASCNVEIKLVLERICAKLDTAPPRAKRAVAGSK